MTSNKTQLHHQEQRLIVNMKCVHVYKTPWKCLELCRISSNGPVRPEFTLERVFEGIIVKPDSLNLS